MIRNLNNLKPKINPNAYDNEAAYVVGEVEIDEFSSVWPGAVIRADSGKISIGKRSNIQDNSAVHSDNGSIIGDDVTIGHGVVIHSKKIGNGNFDIKVTEENTKDEIAFLSKVFNRMTNRLKNQRNKLLKNNRMVEYQREFLEAIISGVKGGIISINKDEKIEIINSAAKLILKLSIDKSYINQTGF